MVTSNASDLSGDIGCDVLANLHAPRRPKVCSHPVKSPFNSGWDKQQAPCADQTRHVIDAH